MIIKPEDVAEAERRFFALSQDMLDVVSFLIDEAKISQMVGVEFQLGVTVGKFTKAIEDNYGYLGTSEEQYGPADNK